MSLKDSALQWLERAKGWPGVRQVVLVQQQYMDEHAGMYANALTYLGFFSLFPMLLLGSSILGFVLRDPESRARVISDIARTIPGFEGILGDALEAIVDARAPTGIIGLALLAWRATSLVRGAGMALTALHHVDDKENPARSLVRAFVAASVLTMFGVGSVVVGLLARFLPGPLSSLGLIVMSLALDLALFLLAYRVLTPGRGPSFHNLWPGALIASIGWNVLKVVGAIVATRTLARTTALYGSLGVALGMLVVLSLAARLFMYGAVINALHMRHAFSWRASPEARSEDV